MTNQTTQKRGNTAARKHDQVESKGTVSALWIKSVSDRRRRAGLLFTRQPYGIELSTLTDKQITALKADPMLVVEEKILTDDEATRLIRTAGADSE